MARTGRDTIVGLGNSTTWGTAVATAATYGIAPISIDQIALQGDSIPDESLSNFNELQHMDIIRHTANPSLTFPMRRTGHQWMFWAQLFGSDAESGIGTITHAMTWADNASYFVTLAIEIGGSDIIEIPSYKTTQITMEPDGDGFMQWVVNGIGNTVNYAGDATNVAGDFDAVTYATRFYNRIPFRELRLRCAAEAGSAFGAGDIIPVSNMGLVISRPYDTEELTRGASTGVEYQTLEPVQNGYSEITLGFDVPDYTTLELLDDFREEDNQRADLYWAKTITTAYEFTVELNELEPMPAEAAIERGQRIPLTRNFRAIQAAANNDMTNGNLIHSILVDNTDVTYTTGVATP